MNNLYNLYMDKIKVTEHAIQEYLNDNPNSLVPEKCLKKKFMDFLSAVKRKEARYREREENWNRVIVFNDVAIVYKDYVIITYYRIYNRVIKRARISFRRNILWILI